MSTKKILASRNSVKTKVDGEYPWSFIAPTKDHAHSGCLSAGNYYGSAVAQPIGKEKAGSMESGPIPQQSKCFSPDEIFYSEDKRG
jgi:hypothetical protein